MADSFAVINTLPAGRLLLPSIAGLLAASSPIVTVLALGTRSTGVEYEDNKPNKTNFLHFDAQTERAEIAGVTAGTGAQAVHAGLGGAGAVWCLLNTG